MNLFLITASTMVAMSVVASQVMAGDALYPYIAPQDCAAGVTAPPNSNQVLFSKTCKYAFVLPPANGTSKVSNFAPSSDLMSCPAVLDNSKTVILYTLMQNESARRMLELLQKNASDPLIEKLRLQNEAIAKDIIELKKRYAGIYGGHAQISIDGTTSEDYIGRWREANHQLMEIEHTIFMRAPVAEGYISFDEMNATEADKQLDPAVLKSNIPGFKAPSSAASDSVVFNGGISGEIDLSLKSACGMLKSLSFATPLEAQLDQSKVASMLVTNFTYSVPVQTGVEYTATLNVDNAIQAMQNQSRAAGQFTVHDILNQHISGSSSQVCEVKFTKYELAANDALAKEKFEDEMTGKICDTLVTRVADRMVTKGFIAAATTAATTVPDAVAGGNVPVTNYHEVCHSHSFLGIHYDSGCGQEAYTTLSWRDGMSSKDLTIENDSENFEGEAAQIDSVIYRWNTMSFPAQ